MNIYTVIVTYNAGNWIENCLLSIRQSSIQSNIIIVDNCSTDNTLSLLEPLSKGVLVIKNSKNVGFGEANNIGIRYALAKGAKYIALLNQDAKLDSLAIETLVSYAEKYPDYGILAPTFFSYDGQQLDEFLLKWVYSFDIALASDVFFKREREVYHLNLMPAAMWLMRCKAIEEVGIFDPLFFMYAEDDDLWIRFNSKGWKTGLFPKAIVYHHTPTGNRFTIKKRIWHCYGNMILQLKKTDKSLAKSVLFFIINHAKITLINLIVFNRSELYVQQVSFFSVLKKLRLVYISRQSTKGKGAFI